MGRGIAIFNDHARNNRSSCIDDDASQARSLERSLDLNGFILCDRRPSHNRSDDSEQAKSRYASHLLCPALKNLLR